MSIIANDGPNSEFSRRLFANFNIPGKLLEVEGGPHGDWGHQCRSVGMQMAAGDWIWHLDADDMAWPGSIAAIRSTVAANPQELHAFRIVNPE